MPISVPTIDEITGHTVMMKMRSLINSYIAFATEISENVPTREEIGEFITPFLSNYYTKEEVDEIIENINISDYYKKSQVDALLDDKANVATTYTKSQVDTLVSPKADASDVYTKSQTDALISPKADASNVYTKTDVDNLISTRANASQVYTKSQVNSLVNPKANASDVYTKTQVDGLVSPKANSSDVYTKTQVDNLVSPKANASDVYTKTETDNLLTNKQNVLTAGTGISISDNVISATGQVSGMVVKSQLIENTDFRKTTSNCVLTNYNYGDVYIIRIHKLIDLSAQWILSGTITFCTFDTGIIYDVICDSHSEYWNCTIRYQSGAGYVITLTKSGYSGNLDLSDATIQGVKLVTLA